MSRGREHRTALIITGDASGGIRAIRSTHVEQEKLNRGFQQGSQTTRQFTRDINDTSQGLTLLRRAATLAIASFSVRQIGAYADGWSDLNARILNATKDTDVAETTMRRIAETANRTYSSLNQTAEAYINNSSALTELGYSTERQLDLADALNNALVVGATKGQQAETVMNALTRSFSAGELRGQNFNSVIENGGRVVDALAEGLGVANSKLRDMAANGELTTGRVFEALTSQMETLRQEADAMPATIEDGWTRIGNASQELVGRVDRAFGASEGIAGVMVGASDAIRASIDPLIDNLDTIGDTATLVAAVIAGRYAASFATATTSMIAKTVASRASIVAEAEAALAVTRRTAAEALAEKRLLGRAVAEARATQGTDAHSAALARLGVQRQRATQAATAHSVATNASATAMARASVTAQGLAVAGRAATGALALVGGPVGVATIAATAFFMFRNSSDEVASSLIDLDEPLETTIENFKQLTAESQQAALIRWGDRQEEEADKARKALASIREEILSLGFENSTGAQAREFFDEVNAGFDAVEAGAQSLDGMLSRLQDQLEVPDSVMRDLRLLAAEYSSGRIAADEMGRRLETLTATYNDVGSAAETAGRRVNNNTPSAKAIEEWEQYNQKIRESIAALRDPSALGAVNRDLDAMGITGQFRRSLTLISAMELERLKEQEERQKQAASAAKTAASEAERASRQQAQAAEQAAKQQATALRSIQHEMEPLLVEHDKYIERLGVIDQALADGTLSQEAYGETVRWAAEQYKRAATGADEYEKQTESLINTYDQHNRKAQELRDVLEQINQRYRAGEIDGDQYARMVGGVRDEMQKLALESDPVAQEMARAWEEASNRIDQTFADAFAGAFDSFDSFADQLLDGFKRLLAELAYQATLKPIVVAFTGDMQSMMSGGRGGLGNTIGAARGLFSGGSSLFGGGAAAASAGAGGLYAGANTGAAMGGLYGNVATGGIAQTGIMSSISSGVTAAMPWIGGALLADNVLGLGITSGITKALGGLFGGGKTKTRLELATGGDANSFEDAGRGGFASGAFGNVGFDARGSQRLSRAFGEDFGAIEQFTAAVAQSDNAVAGLAQSSAELESMSRAVRDVNLRGGSAQDIANQLEGRSRAAIDAMSSDFGRFVQTLGGGIDEVVAQAQAASQAHSVLAGGVERLNLQFNTVGAGAYNAASSIAEMAGGVDALAQAQQGYYQAFFSEAERAAHLQSDLTKALSSMNMQLPQSRDGYRQLVEAQNLNTEAGQRNYTQLLQLAPAFADLVPELVGAGSATRDFAAELSAARDAVSSAEDQVRRAYQTFDNQAYAQQIALLELMGDSEAALALERERELVAIDESLRPHQLRLWALQDEAEAQNAAVQAAKNYVNELARVRDQLASTLGNVAQWVDQRTATSQTPGLNLAEAGDQFARQLILAESGDRSALQSITQYADQYLTAGEAMFASGGAFQSIQEEVLNALKALPEQISSEEYLAKEIRDALQKAVEQLPGGIASSLHPLFDSIDLDASGLIDWNEFYAVFAGMASDEELRRIFNQLDKDGSGTISRLEALGRTSEGTEDNTKNLEDRAREQLKSLGGLVGEMTRTTDQFVGLNSTMVSLRQSINALGVAQAEVAKIERERVAAEQAERKRIEQERTAAARAAEINANISGFESAASVAQSRAQTLGARLDPRDAGNISRLIDNRMSDGQFTHKEWEDMLAHLAKTFGQDSTQYLYGREYAAMYRNQTRANEERAKLNGSHASGLWNVPFDGYIAELHRDEMVVPAGTASRLRDLPAQGLPMPDMPMLQFPQLGNADVVQVLNDLRNENKQLRTDINRLLGDVKTNTGNTANAVASSASRAERQRSEHLEEQRAATRAARLKVRTT